MQERILEFLKENLVAVISIAVACISVAGSIFYVYYNECGTCEVCETITILEQDESEEEQEENNTVKIDVKGAVKNPGVYELESDSTIFDAITLAGGVTSSGVTTNINLSKRVTDEMVIYVFTKSEFKEATSSNEIVCEIPTCECETITVTPDGCDVTNTTETNSSSSSSSSSSSTGTTVNSLININTATLAELTSLSGIGESKAQSIIDYREANGNFASIEDIKNVTGIGDSIYEKIKDYITV